MSYIENIRKHGSNANPFFCLMGIDIVSYEPGTAVLRMQIRPDMLNGVGWLQGGMLVALADEAIALALYTQLKEHEGIATISESTSFVKGVREGFIVAEAKVIKKGRRVAFAEAEVFLESDEKTMLSRTSSAFAVTVKEYKKCSVQIIEKTLTFPGASPPPLRHPPLR
ncbi:MAG: PaaI family thioesterase [Methanoregula sp.]